MLTPLWLDGPRSVRPALAEPGQYDVVIAGGGISGVLAGLLLARSGRHVAILEARQVGDGATGRSTAKVSLLQGTRLSEICRRRSVHLARQYVEGSREGQAWLRRFVDEHAVPHQLRAAYTYATSTRGLERLDTEQRASAAAGLVVRRTDETDLPVDVKSALVLPDQLQVDPLRLLEALVERFEAEGGELFEATRVVSARHAGEGLVIETSAGVGTTARHLVLATAVPVIDRSVWFARLTAERSYALAAQDVAAPEGMYLSVDDTVRSIRSTPGPEGEILLVGGNGHMTGRADSEEARLRDLEEWTRATFSGARITHRWSAQDFHSPTGLPYAGALAPHDERILVMTGYAKWGFTTAAASALIVAKTILGHRPDWAEAWQTWSSGESRALPALLGSGLATAAVALTGHLGRGPVRRLPGCPGTPSPVCTHLGGRLRWNDAEQTWDCPLHGSRFAADGQVLDGPAVRPLRHPVRARTWTDLNQSAPDQPGAQPEEPPAAHP
jgi:glycine/D-amino acid oxidase-like deaminating enzyme